MKAWSETTLKNVAKKVSYGYTASATEQDTGVKFLRITDIVPSAIDWSTVPNCEISEKDIEKCRLSQGEIVIARTGATVGYAKQIGCNPPLAVFASYLVRVRVRDDICKRFIGILIESNNYKYYINTIAGGSAQPNANAKDLSSYPFYLPPIPIQQKIVALLSTYDELIENNKRRIALLETLAEEIYREWFVRLRFPGHEKMKIVKGVPQSWELEKLEHAFKFTGGGTPSKEVDRYWNGGEVNWFTPSDITGADGIFLGSSGEQCTEEGFNNSSAKMFPAYSVMLTSRATIGAVGINLTPACTNQGFITCIPNARYPLPYLYHWIKLAKPHFELLSGGATFAELTKGTFKRIEILTPPEPIVAEFARIESPLFNAIENHLRANRKLLETREMLLPRLISGKLSVENLDIQFPPGMAEELKAEPTAIVHA